MINRFIICVAISLVLEQSAVAAAPQIPPPPPSSTGGPYLPNSLCGVSLASPGTIVAATRRLISGYNGPVENVSNGITATDIQFAAGSDIQDTSALSALALAGNITVNAVYAQNGSGLNLTASGTSPVHYADFALPQGGWPWGIHTINQSASPAQLVNTTLSGINRNNMTVLEVVSPRSSRQGMYAEFGNSALSSGYAALFIQAPPQGVASYATGTNASTIPARTQPTVVGWSSGSGGQLFYANDKPASNSTVFSSQAIGGLDIGKDIFGAPSNNANVDLWAVIVVPAACSASQLQSATQLLERAFGIPIQMVGTYVLGGSSLTVGYGTTTYDYPGKTMLAMERWPLNWELFNLGTTGQTLATEYANLSTSELSLASSVRPTIIALDAPSNDLAASLSTSGEGQTIYTGILTPMVAAIEAAGAIPEIPTTIPRAAFQGQQAEVEYKIYNNLVRAGTTTQGAILADRAADALVGNESNLSNTSCYNIDGIHPVTNCYQRIATIDAIAAQSRKQLGAINPLFTPNAVLSLNPHTVLWSGTLSGGAMTVTLSGSAVFTSSSSYACAANDSSGAAAAASVSNTSGTSFTVKGSGADTVSGFCAGN